MIGMEAGQSAFGDVYAWFKDLLVWPMETILARNPSLSPSQKRTLVEDTSADIITVLSRAAENIPADESGILALDWMNGRRTPDANQLLKGAMTGLTLASDPPRIFRALVESTAFGARRIVDRFRSEGVRIDGVIALGGVAKKSPFIMQVVADVMNMSISVPRSEQTCALGAAMCAAVVIGSYATIEEAKNAMGSGFETEYYPRPETRKTYDVLYERYVRLADFIEQETRRTEIAP